METKNRSEGAFRTPTGYFDTLGNRIEERIAARNGKSSKVVPMGSPMLWAAAVALLIISGIGFYMMDTDKETIAQTDTKQLFEQVPNESLAAYLEEEVSATEIWLLAQSEGLELAFNEYEVEDAEASFQYLGIDMLDLELMLNE